MTCSNSISSLTHLSTVHCIHTLRHSDASHISTQLGSLKGKPCHEVASKAFEKVIKTTLSTVSFVSNKGPSSTYNSVTTGKYDKKPLEEEVNPKLQCKYCNQLHTYYHKHVYSELVTKKIF